MPHQAPIRLRWLAAAQVSILVASLLAPLAAQAAVWTDQQDYAPGSVVTISGDNSDDASYQVGEVVNVDVAGPNGYAQSCAATVSEDPADNGLWSCQVTLQDSLDAVGDYSYTATGQTSGFSENGAFTDRASTNITGVTFAWLKNGSIGGGTGFDVTVAGTFLCTTGNPTPSCSSPTAVRVDLYTSNGTPNNVSGSPVATKNATPSSGSFTTTFAFRTAPGAGQFAILSDAKYDAKATLVATISGTAGTDAPNADVDDDRFGVDNTAPLVVIDMPLDNTGPQYDVSGTASDATSGLTSGTPVHVKLYKVVGGAFEASPTGSWDANDSSGTWQKQNYPRPTDPGTYCFVASVEDNAGNPASTTSAVSGAHCFTVAASDAAPSVSSTTPTNGAVNVARSADIGITFGESVNVTGSWYLISCAVTGTHAAVVTGGPATFTLNPGTDFAKSELCTVTVYAANVTDQDTSDPPDTMAANYSFSFTTAANLAPSADAGDPYSGVEGDHVALDGTGSSDADGTVAAYSWAVTPQSGGPSDPDAGASCSFVDGTGAMDAQPKVACTDDGIYDVILTVTDNDGATDVDTTTLTLSNANPTATKAFDSDVDEGGSFSLALTGGSDPGSDDTLTYAFDCGAGSGYAVASAAASTSCPTSDDGLRSVKAKIIDDDGGYTEYTGSVTVDNVAPTIAISGASNVNEGSAYSLTLGAVTDPGTDTVTAYIVHWGDGTSSTYASNGVKTHTYADGPNTYAITVDLTDEDGTFLDRANDLSVTVDNVAPTIAISGASNVNEGSAYSLTLGAVTDPGTDTVTAYIVHWGDGTSSTYASNGVKTHTYADGPNTYAITVDLTDEDGTFLDRANDLSVTVDNVAPVITSFTGPTDPVALGTAVTLNGAFTDAGTLDTHAATIAWGDGSSSSGVVSETNGSGSVSGTHTYTAAGIYTVSLTVTDKDGGADSATFQYVVVYDPSAGFVTGGGWINSPAGAYRVDETMTGKATFGFVSKYNKGATIPTGNTEFQFHAAGLNFKSTSYQWLVVSGAKATYKGVGTINGAGNYGFLLSAIDGQLTGGGGVDKFRIKIWDRDNGDAVVYDNLVGGGGDDANPTTILGGGSIVIHTGKK